MRIGFFFGSFSAIGASHTVIAPLALALQAMGHEVFVLEISRLRRTNAIVEGLSVQREPILPHLLRQPLDLVRVLVDRLLNSLRRRQPARPHIPYNLAIGAAQLNFARSKGLDVLYTCANTNVHGVVRQGVPSDLLFAINLIGFGIDHSRGGASDTFGYQEAIFGRPHWDLHIAASDFEYQQYCKVYNDLELPPERLCRLPHSYDIERFHPVPAKERCDLRQRYDLPQEHVVLVYPVNVYPRKNIEMAVEAAALLNQSCPTTLVVSGAIWDSAYEERLRVCAQRLGLDDRLLLLRGIAHDQMNDLYNLADAVIWPSHQETFGLGIIESLACGTPVIGPDWIPPCREILDEQPGGWLAPKDAAAFAERVLLALRERPERELIAAEARKRFGNETVARQFLAEVEPRLERKRAGARRLREIDWRALYENEYDLTGQRKIDVG